MIHKIISISISLMLKESKIST